MTKLSNTDVEDSDIYELLAQRRQVAVIWNIEDVQSIRPDLDDEQSWQVLEECRDQHDCEYGFNWTFIEDVADLTFPAKGAKS